MDRLIPWERLEKRIEPFYPKAGRGRRPYPPRSMLRVHCVQLFHDPERPGNGGSALRGGVGAPIRGPAADGSAAGRGVAFGDVTILKFRHLLEEHGLGEGLFEEINAHLASLGHSARKGDDRGRDDHRGRRVRRRTRSGSGIRRCTGRRRATSGTSG